MNGGLARAVTGKEHLVEEHGTGPDAASLAKKLRRVWAQGEAHHG